MNKQTMISIYLCFGLPQFKLLYRVLIQIIDNFPSLVFWKGFSPGDLEFMSLIKTSQPGVEPGSRVPETLVLPLHHWDFTAFSPLSLIYSINHPSLQFESFLKSMSLEATLIMLDNSAYSINGDYEPTRWESQVVCAQLLIQAKLQANQQSSVGVGLMGGSQVQILCTLTSDQTKASSYLFGIKPSGELHFSQAIQIGALSLKHRSNQTQKQRMVCFVGSTINEDIQTLKILAKKLKKNTVAVDIICFGDCSEEQVNKVQTFIDTIQNEDNSHCVFVEPGKILSDDLIASPILGGAAGEAGGMGGIEVDDPELAAAIRMSLQEANQGQAAPQQQAAQQPVIAPPQPSRQAQPEANNPHEPTEQQLQQLAIQMSLQEFNLKQSGEKQEEKEEKKVEENPQGSQKSEDKQKKQ